MLAQATEVFLEKQIMDNKKIGLLAKLSSQASYLYNEAVEGAQDNVNRVIFEKIWLLVVQVRAALLAGMRGPLARYPITTNTLLRNR
jgi:hypothetical protein